MAFGRAARRPCPAHRRVPLLAAASPPVSRGPSCTNQLLNQPWTTTTEGVSEDCDTACANIGRTCEDGALIPTSEQCMEELTTSLGVTCGNYYEVTPTDSNTGRNPQWAPNFDRCYWNGPGTRGFECAGYSLTTFQRFCACGDHFSPSPPPPLPSPPPPSPPPTPCDEGYEVLTATIDDEVPDRPAARPGRVPGLLRLLADEHNRAKYGWTKPPPSAMTVTPGHPTYGYGRQAREAASYVFTVYDQDATNEPAERDDTQYHAVCRSVLAAPAAAAAHPPPPLPLCPVIERPRRTTSSAPTSARRAR